jgi:hypothetical protein
MAGEYVVLPQQSTGFTRLRRVGVEPSLET